MNRIVRIVRLGAGVGILSMAGMVSAQHVQGLFDEVEPTAVKADVKMDPTVVRARVVKIAPGQLQGGAGGAQMDGARLRLNFFPDVDYTLQIDRTEGVGDGDYALFGSIEGVALGRCTLIVQNDKVTGNCSSPSGIYQARYHSDGMHVVREIDQSRFPPEANPIEVSTPGAAAIEPLGRDPDPLKDGQVHPDDAQADDDGSIVDMLVAYTTTTKNASTNIVGEILLAVAETNQAYINSNVPHRVRLVGTSEVTYTESGTICGTATSDLDRLRGTTDGYMDNLHSIRNSLGADQVTLIVENGGGYCGCAFLMDPVASTFESSAFSVVARNCATGYFSFAHELGHNMSARHDCYVDPTLTPYAHNHGYVHLSSTPSQRWRTIMAYDNQCVANGYNCTRIQYFSNPAISYLGAPTGTTGTGCTADNQLTHANTDLTVSRFRDGYCSLSGMVEQVLSYADSASANNYVYVRPSATASYYQYFRTTDDDMASTAVGAARRKMDVSIRGNQSCFGGAYDFGGDIDYMIVNP